MINFLYNLYPIEDIIPSIIRLYIGMHETVQMIIQIVDETTLLHEYSHITYLNNYKPLYLTSNVNLIYSDIQYWDHVIRQFPICKSNYNNHFNTNLSSSGISVHFEKSQLWMETYPIINYGYLWSLNIESLFKVKFQGFIIPNLLDLNYISNNVLRHHDYVSKTIISSNIFWHKNMDVINNSNYGLFIFWYEHYGAVEIGLKAIFTYWYQLCYPQFEELNLLIDIPSRLYPVSLSDKQYAFKIARIIEDLKISNHYL